MLIDSRDLVEFFLLSFFFPSRLLYHAFVVVPIMVF